MTWKALNDEYYYHYYYYYYYYYYYHYYPAMASHNDYNSWCIQKPDALTEF